MKLFLSFSYLLTALVHDAVKISDLDHGIFAFSATRELVVGMEPEDIQVQLCPYSESEKKIYLIVWKMILLPSVLKAEQEGRILYRKDGKREIDFELFTKFLNIRGILVPRELQYKGYPSYPNIKDVLLPLNPQLEIIA